MTKRQKSKNNKSEIKKEIKVVEKKGLKFFETNDSLRLFSVLLNVVLVLAVVYLAIAPGAVLDETLQGIVEAREMIENGDCDGAATALVVLESKLSIPEAGTALDGTVTIEVYSEYLCPYCQRFAQQTLAEVKDKYPDNVIIEHKNFIVHAQAQKAAEAVECARDQDKFNEMHETIFNNYGAVAVDELKGYAVDIGLDTTRFNSCLDSGEKEVVVQAQTNEGRQKGVSGTPTSFVGGKKIVGAVDFATIEEEILNALNGTTEPEMPDPEFDMIVLNDRDCQMCDSTQIEQITKTELFPTVNIVRVDYNTDEGKTIAENLGIKALPAYIFDSAVEETAMFEEVVGAMLKVDDAYILNPAAVGAVKYLELPSIEGNAFLGKDDAELTIILFSEFQCPYSKRFMDDTLDIIMETYEDNVKFVYKHFPLSFHPDAPKAAEASECANDQDKFWEMHDKMYANQQALSVDDLKAYAVDIELDADEFNACLDTGKYAQKVQNDFKEGMEFGVSGTPAFFVNDIFVSGAQPFEVFKQVIDAELQ